MDHGAGVPAETSVEAGHGGHGHGMDKHTLMVIHGALMLLGWVVLLPLGIMASVFRARIGKRNGTVADGELPTWLKWHRSLQISGAAVGVVGYGIAKAMTEHHSHALWISFHHKIGALLTLYSIVQLCLGLFRPHAPTKAEGKTRRREVWEAVHKKGGYVVMSLALVQVFVGAALAPDFAGSAELTWVVVCAVTVVGTLSFGLMASKMTTEFRGVAPAPAPSPVPEQGAEASTAADAESSRNP